MPIGSDVTLNALYALEAALIGCNWRELPNETKEQLRATAKPIGGGYAISIQSAE